MKKILFAIVIIALLSSNVSVVSASSNPCDSLCVKAVLERKLSDAEIRNIGYGNVVKAVTARLKGNLQSALYLTGLGNNTFASNANANAIYGTKLDGTVEGLALCGPEDSFICADGAIWGYSEVAVYECTTDVCKKEYFHEN